jgi:hypothetical protein
MSTALKYENFFVSALWTSGFSGLNKCKLMENKNIISSYILLHHFPRISKRSIMLSISAADTQSVIAIESQLCVVSCPTQFVSLSFSLLMSFFIELHVESLKEPSSSCVWACNLLDMNSSVSLIEFEANRSKFNRRAIFTKRDISTKARLIFNWIFYWGFNFGGNRVPLFERDRWEITWMSEARVLLLVASALKKGKRAFFVFNSRRKWRE